MFNNDLESVTDLTGGSIKCGMYCKEESYRCGW